MLRFQLAIRQLLTWIVPIAVALAMIARAAMSWEPTNLVVLCVFVMMAAAILACLPIVPHRPFWAGLATFGFGYIVLWLFCATVGLGLATDPIYRELAELRYGPAPNFKTSTVEEWNSREDLERLKTSSVALAHALTAITFGIFGGLSMQILARWQESRRWDRVPLPELPLEDFLLPPITIDRPLNSK